MLTEGESSIRGHNRESNKSGAGLVEHSVVESNGEGGSLGSRLGTHSGSSNLNLSTVNFSAHVDQLADVDGIGVLTATNNSVNGWR